MVTDVTVNNGTGRADGTTLSATIGLPSGIAVDSMDNIYVTQPINSRLRRIGADGVVSTVANGFFNGITLIDDTTAYVTSASRRVISQLNLTDGSNSIVAGQQSSSGNTDGIALTEALFNFPLDITLAANGDFYVADSSSGNIRLISSFNQFTLSGTPTLVTDVGNHSVILQATDGSDSSTQGFTLTVSNSGIRDISEYADGTGDTPSVTTYINAGVSSVTSSNLVIVNTAILAAGDASAADSVSEIQSIAQCCHRFKCYSNLCQ